MAVVEIEIVGKENALTFVVFLVSCAECCRVLMRCSLGLAQPCNLNPCPVQGLSRWGITLARSKQDWEGFETREIHAVSRAAFRKFLVSRSQVILWA